MKPLNNRDKDSTTSLHQKIQRLFKLVLLRENIASALNLKISKEPIGAQV